MLPADHRAGTQRGMAVQVRAHQRHREHRHDQIRELAETVQTVTRRRVGIEQRRPHQQPGEQVQRVLGVVQRGVP